MVRKLTNECLAVAVNGVQVAGTLPGPGKYLIIILRDLMYIYES